MGKGLPVVSGRQAVSALTHVGFQETPRRGKGSHIIVIRVEPRTLISIPDHRELDRGTLRSIIRHAGLSVEQFNELLD